MNTGLICAAIALFIFQSLSMKLQKAPGLADKLFVNCLFCALAAAGLGAGAALMPSAFMLSGATALYGLGFGLCFALTILFYNLAVSTGPLSYTAFYFSASMLIPTLAGLLWFGEPFSPGLAVGLALFLAAFYLLNSGAGGQMHPRPHWGLYCLLTFLCNGLSAVVQKAQQRAAGGGEAFGFMLVGFSGAALCYALAYFAARRTGGRQAAALLRDNRLAIVLLALGSAGGNVLLTILAGRVAASYLFPLVQGSIVVGVAACSALFFHEKPSARGKLGLLLGACAIAAMNL